MCYAQEKWRDFIRDLPYENGLLDQKTEFSQFAVEYGAQDFNFRLTSQHYYLVYMFSKHICAYYIYRSFLVVSHRDISVKNA